MGIDALPLKILLPHGVISISKPISKLNGRDSLPPFTTINLRWVRQAVSIS
jgi:hypothetical protein